MTKSKSVSVKITKSRLFFVSGLCSLCVPWTNLAASQSKLSEKELEKVTQDLEKSKSILTKKPFVIFGNSRPVGFDIEVVTGVKELANLNQEFRARVLDIQDALAQEASNTIPFHLVLRSKKSDAQINSVKEIETAQDQFAIIDLFATLDDIPYLHLNSPMFSLNDQSMSIFSGPLPSGNHTLSLKIVAAKLIHGAPFTVSQGRWHLEKTFSFVAKKSVQNAEKSIGFWVKDGSPQLTMSEERE